MPLRSRTWFTLPITLLLLLQAAPTVWAAAQDDAGTGADAPDDYYDAVDVTLTAFEGTLDPVVDDREDWYRFAVPAGQGIKVTLTPDVADFDLLVLDDFGQYLGGSFWFDNETEHVTTGTATGAVRIGILQFSGSGSYAVAIEYVDLPDFALTALEITEQPTHTPLGAVTTGMQREVRVTVENLASNVSGEAYVDVMTYTEDGGRMVGFTFVALEAGESVDLTFDWDATGQAGDVTVVARVYSFEGDGDRSNDFLIQQSQVVAGGAGIGVDALNRGAFIPLPFLGGAFVGHYYDGWGTGAYVLGFAPRTLVYADVGVSKHDDEPYAYGCAYALVGTCTGL